MQSAVKVTFDHYSFLGNMEFMGGDLDLPGSYLDAVKGCEGVFICALPETPRYVCLLFSIEYLNSFFFSSFVTLT